MLTDILPCFQNIYFAAGFEERSVLRAVIKLFFRIFDGIQNVNNSIILGYIYLLKYWCIMSCALKHLHTTAYIHGNIILDYLLLLSYTVKVYNYFSI